MVLLSNENRPRCTLTSRIALDRPPEYTYSLWRPVTGSVHLERVIDEAKRQATVHASWGVLPRIILVPLSTCLVVGNRRSNRPSPLGPSRAECSSDTSRRSANLFRLASNLISGIAAATVAPLSDEVINTALCRACHRVLPSDCLFSLDDQEALTRRSDSPRSGSADLLGRGTTRGNRCPHCRTLRPVTLPRVSVPPLSEGA